MRDASERPRIGTDPVTALIVHPDAAERAALGAVLDSGERIRVVTLTDDGDAAVTLAHRQRPAVVLLDERVNAPDNRDLIQALARWSRVIVLTGAAEHSAIRELLCAPVRGCLVYGHFEASDLLGAVRAVAAGLGWLSPVAVAAATWQLRSAR
ncbi:response regulator transcription factor [Micromonospora sp. C95]|uniref:response regulator transcription factor n=1 Tax=Micromonospora sp. C95 TaxID=2824882 RepID=UPI001B37D274|nr:response regulator transcription factor [Micromonospora sp. C95]MBQ1027853.1 response regulator transcription factor [Micromonospora sp. C95]